MIVRVCVRGDVLFSSGPHRIECRVLNVSSLDDGRELGQGHDGFLWTSEDLIVQKAGVNPLSVFTAFGVDS